MSSRLRSCLAILAATLAAPAIAADAPQDGIAWLKKMAAASRGLNYSGTFVYRNASRSETSLFGTLGLVF